MHEWDSYGGYIYSWPSKYDQVFWPYTDDNGVWYCEASGFAAFLHDFDNLTSAQKEKIQAYLAAHQQTPSTPEERLKRLEAIYGLRDRDQYFAIFLKRLMAYKYDEWSKPELATAYRKDALADMEKALATTLDQGTRIEYLYVCANYARELGDVPKSEAHLAELAMLLKEPAPKAADFANYIQQLIPDTAKIRPGGSLSPDE